MESCTKDEAALLGMNSARKSFVVKIVIGALLLTLVLERVPMAGAMEALGRLTFFDLVAAAVLYFVAHVVNSIKLRLFLPRLSIRQSLRFTMIGVLYGTALPGQLAGDAVKAFRLTRALSSAGGAGITIAAVAMDKLLGLFALLVLTAIGLAIGGAVFGSDMVKIVGLGLAIFITLLAIAVAAPIPEAFEHWTAQFST